MRKLTAMTAALMAAALMAAASAAPAGGGAQRGGRKASAARTKRDAAKRTPPRPATSDGEDVDDEDVDDEGVDGEDDAAETTTFWRGALPKPSGGAGGGRRKPSPPTYRRRPNPAAMLASVAPAEAADWLRATQERRQVGVTLWKLRPFQQGDNEAVVIEATVNGRTERWTPVRATLSAPPALGEKVRLTLEMQEEGYLYVVNYEVRRGGRLGAPTLAYPRPGERLYVRRGELIGLPDRSERAPYFELVAAGDERDYAGELLLVVAASEPIDDAVWRTTRRGRFNVIENATFAAGLLRHGLQAALYEGAKRLGAAETTAEERAERTRGVALGADDPPPQTVLGNTTAEAKLGGKPARLLVTLVLLGGGR